MTTTIDEYSLSTVPLRQFFDATHLGFATAFVWERNNAQYLITNWHVVSGRNFQTGENILENGGRPNRVHTQYNPRLLSFNKWSGYLPLYDTDGKPLWLVHPAHGHDVDIVALPLTLLAPESPYAYYPINNMSSMMLDVRIGMDVFILGYPFGDAAPGFPVWKRGSIASEPQIVRLGEKYFLVDTASRPGMSGAPVILRSWGTHMLENDNVSMGPGNGSRFVGIYSGRLFTKDKNEIQLGLVWPHSFIEEIIDGAHRDNGS